MGMDGEEKNNMYVDGQDIDGDGSTGGKKERKTKSEVVG